MGSQPVRANTLRDLLVTDPGLAQPRAGESVLHIGGLKSRWSQSGGLLCGPLACSRALFPTYLIIVASCVWHTEALYVSDTSGRVQTWRMCVGCWCWRRYYDDATEVLQSATDRATTTAYRVLTTECCNCGVLQRECTTWLDPSTPRALGDSKCNTVASLVFLGGFCTRFRFPGACVCGVWGTKRNLARARRYRYTRHTLTHTTHKPPETVSCRNRLANTNLLLLAVTQRSGGRGVEPRRALSL